MRRTLLVAVLAALLLPGPAHAASACGVKYTQAHARSYVRAVYSRELVRQPAKQRVAHMVRCQHSAKATHNVRRYVKRKRGEYRQRTYWTRRQAALSPAVKAMLARLRGCETRGIPYPQNYQWDGHHDGAYQYDKGTWGEAGGSGYAYQASPAEQDVRTAWFFPSHRGRWDCSA